MLTPKVYGAYLSIRNPYMTDAQLSQWYEIKRPKDMKGRSVVTADKIGKWAKDNGYDGAVIKNVVEVGTMPSTDYIAFDSTQIKRATDNVGTYDESNPDIRFSVAGLGNRITEGNGRETGEPDVPEMGDDEAEEEMRRIREKALADGTFMKAPNGKPTNLNERQWLQARTDAFKRRFGDWEKAARIEKLKKSKSVKITGKEIKPSDDINEYRKNALQYGKNLQGQYTNKDTGAVIQLQRGRKNGGVKEVLRHNYYDIEHLQSVAAIPQIIESSIFIERETNFDKEKNPDVKEYQHFVCGLRIGSEDYTVRSVIAVQNNGERYYDHRVTNIEKTKLLALIKEQAVDDADFGATPDKESTISNPIVKDKRILSILQTNSSKVLDGNGEPLASSLEEIKGATENGGLFDGSNPDIRFSRLGEVVPDGDAGDLSDDRSASIGARLGAALSSAERLGVRVSPLARRDMPGGPMRQSPKRESPPIFQSLMRRKRC